MAFVYKHPGEEALAGGLFIKWQSDHIQDLNVFSIKSIFLKPILNINLIPVIKIIL